MSVVVVATSVDLSYLCLCLLNVYLISKLALSPSSSFYV